MNDSVRRTACPTSRDGGEGTDNAATRTRRRRAGWPSTFAFGVTRAVPTCLPPPFSFSALCAPVLSAHEHTHTLLRSCTIVASERPAPAGGRDYGYICVHYIGFSQGQRRNRPIERRTI